MPLADDSAWQDFRDRMPISGRWAYFDHAAVAPLPEPAREAIEEWARDTANNGDANWLHWSRQVGEVRGLAAKLIHASTEEIALVRNTTEGITLVAEGFPWQAGDNVVSCAAEFPSNLYPWRNLAGRGVELRTIPSRAGEADLAKLDAACDARTKIVAISWVGFATGYRLNVDDVVEIAHRHGALLALDAIQGLGVFPLDVRGTKVDFLAADGHKWLLGPEGAGVFYVRKEHLDLLRPLGIGWNSVQHAGDYSNPQMALKRTAARYEGGTYPVPGFVGLNASLKLLADYSTQDISQRLLAVTDRACEALSKVGANVVSDRSPERRSGIVAFEMPGQDPQQVRRRCLDRNIVLSVRNGRLRIAPHVYNNAEDLEELAAAVSVA